MFPWSRGKTSIHSWDTTCVAQPSGYLAALQTIYQILDEEIKILGGDSTKVFLAGHSQGSTMALTAGLTYGQRLGGIIGLSGFYGSPTIPQTEANSKTPILVINGKKDFIVQMAQAKASYLAGGLLSRNNFKWEQWAGLTHTPTDAVWARLAEYVKECMT